MKRLQYLLINASGVFVGLLVLFCSVLQAQNLALSLPEVPGSPVAMQSVASQSNSVVASKPSAPATGVPTDHIVKDGGYTNNFFRFSIQFPEAWKILGTGTPLTQTGNGGVVAGGIAPVAGGNIASGYVLFWAGTVDQTKGQHWVVICAVKPTSSARNATPEKYLKAEADALKLGSAEYLKKGQTPPLVAGEPTEFRIAGRRMSRLDETGEVNGKAASLVTLAIDERGYLILFMFSDPVGDESNYQAAKAISSLRFIGRAN
jgi:hypothetical protein